MSGVRVLVGTRKGAFVLTSDGKRQKWEIEGPHFAGWEIYHVKGSAADGNRIYASQSSSWFGQIIQRSDDGGKTWFQPGTPAGEPVTTPDGMPKGESNKFVYDASPETGKPLTTHQWYDGTPHPWEFKRVWHLEPSLTDPDTAEAGHPALSAAVTLPIAIGFWAGFGSPVFIMSLAVFALVVWTHRSNIARLRRGEEPKVGRKAEVQAR